MTVRLREAADGPGLGEIALHLESRFGRGSFVRPHGQNLIAEIAQTVADTEHLDLAALLVCCRALHVAAAICVKRGDEDAEPLHDMAQRLIAQL